MFCFKALERYDTVGTQLVFTDDYQTWWGPGWEFDFGLKYTKVREDYMVKKIELILLYISKNSFEYHESINLHP